MKNCHCHLLCHYLHTPLITGLVPPAAKAAAEARAAEEAAALAKAQQERAAAEKAAAEKKAADEGEGLPRQPAKRSQESDLLPVLCLALT